MNGFSSGVKGAEGAVVRWVGDVTDPDGPGALAAPMSTMASRWDRAPGVSREDVPRARRTGVAAPGTPGLTAGDSAAA